MSLSGDRTFVGFGFGAIQSGLFLYEAFHSGNFRRLVVAEVVPGAVKTLRDAGGWYAVNVAHRDRVETDRIGSVEIANPGEEPDRDHLISAIAEAQEIATALPSVCFYVSNSDGSAHRVLAEGLLRKADSHGPPAVIYAAENHNRAAEILEEAVLGVLPPRDRDRVRSHACFLNTVIGKMSGVIVGPDEIRERNLSTVTPQERRAFLVEAFNRILITRITTRNGFPGDTFRRGIEVFEEKPDLLPFEEAKLYGHNSTHAIAAYLGAVLGATRISDLARIEGVKAFLEQAFVEESGEALIRKHKGVDPLFTPEGYRAYAIDLIERMFNPYLGDSVDRVGRDPGRKLEWDDRLVGTIRVALREGVNPRRFAFGTAAACTVLAPTAGQGWECMTDTLDGLWAASSPEPAERKSVLRLLEEGHAKLQAWREAGLPHLGDFFNQYVFAGSFVRNS